jgi:hypothetical protein
MGLPVAAKSANPPSPLPISLSEDSRWQPTPAQQQPPGTWAPSAPAAAPQLPPPNLQYEPGASLVKPALIARGQMPEASRPDPVITLIQGVCRGRADGIDIRWTGSKKLSVCFEVRTQPEANRLVKDISARPELAALAIDFCVLVK